MTRAFNLIRSDLQSIETDLCYTDSSHCRLHMNELPWAPISFSHLNLNHYPKPNAYIQLQERLAHHYHVPTSSLLLTRGSDEGIDLLMRLFLQPGINSVLQCSPTFSMYAFYARLQQAQVIDCPLNDAEEFSLNLESIQKKWQPHCTLMILCSPNNPTAHLIEHKTIVQLCTDYKNRSMIVVDEAYIEFSDALSVTRLMHQLDNLIVLRTLSKAHGLAGLRLGAVIAHPVIVSALKKITAPFSFSSVVLELGLSALHNSTWFDQAIHTIKTLRSQLMIELKKSIWIDKIYDSASNFILVKTRFARALGSYLESLNISVRQFAHTPVLAQHIRITVGDADQNQKLLTALASFKGAE